MQLSMSLAHVGLFVRNLEPMIDLYTRLFGFIVSDRGPLPGGGEIAFLTRSPRDHHQVVFASGRPDGLPFDVVQQLSFRLGSLAQLREMWARVKREKGLTIEGPTLGTVTHGNAISGYFRDYEGHRTEMFVDTPWHVVQPMREPIDLAWPEAEIMAVVEKHARALPGTIPVADWHRDQEARLARAAIQT